MLNIYIYIICVCVNTIHYIAMMTAVIKYGIFDGDLYTFRGCMGFPLFLVFDRENGAYKGGAPYFAQLVQLESHCWVYGRYIHSL